MPVNARNISVWKSFTTLPYMGIPNLISANETVLDSLGKNLIASNIVIVDDKIRIMEEQRDTLIQLEYDTITNEMLLSDMDAATKRAVMALQIAAHDYMMLVENYIVEVLNLITDAKEYAFEVGQNAIDLARIKAEIAEEKGAIYIQKVDLQIQLEEIERKHVEIELLRAELAAAKAQTRLIMAEIDIARAELALVEANVKVAMADLEKIQIEVDIAMVLADIIVRQLTTVKYNVEVAEIAANYQMIADNLEAILAIMTEKQIQIVHQSKSKEEILIDLVSLNASNIESQSKRIDDVNSDQAVYEHEAIKINDLLTEEQSKISLFVEEKLNEIIARVSTSTQVDEKQAWASALLDAAYIIATSRTARLTSVIHLGQHVHPNSSISCG